MASGENVQLPEETAVDRLAAQFGIEPGFRNARGEEVVTSKETQKRLLAAMGVDAVSNPYIAVNVAQSADSKSPLPGVLVIHSADGCCAVDMELPIDVRRLAWRIELEDGGERSGVADVPSHMSAPIGRAQNKLHLQLGELPWGYHRLHLPECATTWALIVTPGKCWLPSAFHDGTGLWGIAAQLYLLKSEYNWGIGDFADLKNLVQISAARGCDVIGLNPLHQMALDSPEQASPYSPLTRLYLNVLYISVPEAPGYSSAAAVHELINSPEFRARLSACRAAPGIDYSGVVDLKLKALRILCTAFANSAPEDRQSFERFRIEQGVSLRRTSIFQALRQHFAAEDLARADWHNWADEYRNPTSDAVEHFAVEHAEQIDFFDWLQWVADEQLAEAARAARKTGMAIGLYRDLAVGCDRSGAETWANPGAFLAGAQVGAPPDIFNPAGQDWGLPPFHPNALRDEAYGSFVELIRANMRHAGGLRIDHVMGLQHLYCIPEGCSPADGAYIGYPIDDLVGILALESQRHRCLVVGEDLGTVPAGFREKMAAANILSYRVLFFEQDWDHGGFVTPQDYPRHALAVAGSHDLPTLVGWWEGRDIDQKERLGLYPTGEARSQRERREQDRASILQAFRKEGLLEAKGDISPDQFAIAAHEFLALSRSALVLPQLDDLLGEADQVNVPATSFENPNWRRKYQVALEEIASDDDSWRRLGRLPELRKPNRQGTHAG
jgi:4-alpha-glucanotransferase